MKSKQADMLVRLAGQQLRNLASAPQSPADAPLPAVKPKGQSRPKAQVPQEPVEPVEPVVPVEPVEPVEQVPVASGAGGEPPIEPPIDHDEVEADSPPEYDVSTPSLFDMAVCQGLDDFEEMVLEEVLAKLRQYRPLLAALGLDNPDGIQAKLTAINEAMGDPLAKIKGVVTPIVDQVTEMMGEAEGDDDAVAATDVQMTIAEVESAIESGNWGVFPLIETGTDVSGHLFTIAGTACGWLKQRPSVPGVPWNNRFIWRTRNGLVMY